jgi:general secretion pathway protein I
MTRKEGQAGFTLLEVLVATAILGTAVAGLLGLLSSAVGNARRLQAPEQAMMLARSEMNRLLAETAGGEGSFNSPLKIGEKIQGQWDEQFRWEAMATPYRSSAERRPGELFLARVVFEVFWKGEPGAAEKKMTWETVQLWREPANAGAEQ